MVHHHLAVYLNDHLAGASAALDILARLKEAHAETLLGSFLTQLHTDIDADRQELEALMSHLGVAPSRTRQAAAWFAEKVSDAKLRFDDEEEGTMYLFEGLEALSLGIAGKRGLWQALDIVAENTPELRGVDYARLMQRAEDQHRQVEAERLRAARPALSATS